MDLNETLHSCNTLPADVHEGIWFEHHSIASGGYHSVRSLTILVICKTDSNAGTSLCTKKQLDCNYSYTVSDGDLEKNLAKNLWYIHKLSMH